MKETGRKESIYVTKQWLCVSLNIGLYKFVYFPIVSLFSRFPNFRGDSFPNDGCRFNFYGVCLFGFPHVSEQRLVSSSE
jgi:hypothetical protein